MSLHKPIEATVLYNRICNYSAISLKVDVKEFQNRVKQIQQKWEATYPNHIFSTKFLNEEMREFYESEKRLSTLVTIFTGIAIFIGCLGLFGLARFMANQKTKEIGVRKLLGASVESIVFLFSKEYIKLILIGFVVASPLAWYVMNLLAQRFCFQDRDWAFYFFSWLRHYIFDRYYNGRLSFVAGRYCLSGRFFEE